MGDTGNDSGIIRTLFITGLPHDLKEREIYNLFRGYAGYEGCRIQYGPEGSTRPPAVFAIFDSQAHALEAKEMLQGARFDPDAPEELRIDLAKSNSKPKRERDDGNPGRNPKQMRGLQGASAYNGMPPNAGLGQRMFMYEQQLPPQIPQQMYSGFEPSQAAFNIAASQSLALRPSGYDGSLGGPLTAAPAAVFSGYDAPSRGGRGHEGNPPCATIYVHNLSQDCSEGELTNIFSTFAGYKKMVFSMKPGKTPVAWVDFMDEIHSGAALQALQGLVPPSGRGTDLSTGLRIEFAKQRIRR